MSIWSRLRRNCSSALQYRLLSPADPRPVADHRRKNACGSVVSSPPSGRVGRRVSEWRLPQVRRALAGADAHECMYTWVYISELVTVRDMATMAAREAFGPARSAAELTDRFDRLKSATNDAQNSCRASCWTYFCLSRSSLRRQEPRMSSMSSSVQRFSSQSRRSTSVVGC